MNKDEFLRRLEALLSDISEEERAEAMAFYYSYFEDAGEGNEANILAELESPEKVAETIKRDLGMVVTVNGNGQNMSDAASTGYKAGAGNTASTGYTSGAEDTAGTGYSTGANSAGYTSGYTNANDSWNAYQNSQSYGNYDSVNQSMQPKKKDNTLVIVLVVIIAILTSPAWIGVLGGLLGTLFGLLVSIAAVTIALTVSAIGLFVAGVSCLATGFVASGFALIGASLLVLALAILSLIACVWVYGGFLPWLCKSIIGLFKKNKENRREQSVA